MTFLDKLFGKWNKVEKPTLVSMSFEGSDDDEEIETVLSHTENNNNNNNILSSLESDDKVKKICLKNN